MPPPRSQSRSRIGCGFLLVAVLITGVLLTINSLIVSNAWLAAVAVLQPGAIDPRLGQILVFLGPIGLLAIEWWVFDVVTDWLRPRRVEKG